MEMYDNHIFCWEVIPINLTYPHIYPQFVLYYQILVDNFVFLH